MLKLLSTKLIVTYRFISLPSVQPSGRPEVKS